ncbi:MAG TPA: adenylate/guanylate cyclase domain-containing protein [Pyrinomonadaceae bacterium]|jgi:class 3 adenylate cyclase|nr:adenylate/guanylate cyclase domain-containing protein [Pyrinomonadaceae bacterium]
MPSRELHYHWEYTLKASPEKLWPFVADTNRFNRDTGVPSVEPAKTTRERLRNARRRLRLSMYGMAVEWEEQPFEWVRPSRFGVARTYSKGPITELRALVELKAGAAGGTNLSYDFRVQPRSLVGAFLVSMQVKFSSASRFAKAFRKYDQIASAELEAAPEDEVELDAAVRSRLEVISQKLLAEGVSVEIVDRLVSFVGSADDFSLARIRPYVLADEWKLLRRDVLEACLRSTRFGLLDLQWELLCPLCRGAGETGKSLSEISSQVHCETCRIDFTVNFDRFVEVTFRPNALLRQVQSQNFCMGSPQKTPHIVAQQLLPSHSLRELTLPLEPGRYRLRALELSGGQDVSVSEEGQAAASVTIADAGWPIPELRLALQSSLKVENATSAEQLLILERLAWSDQSATAAEVTAFQMFRDLFASEALRPGEQISVGTLTVLFTDLRNSTQLYREIGDATAFGRVMNHFDVLKQVIAEEDGALVKTIGDAVMAVFRKPSSALKAMLRAQEMLAMPAAGVEPLTLKAGVHTGPCIAVTLNGRLDYFGSTVNMAARLEGLSTGNDVIISQVLYDDPEVRTFVASEDLQATPFEMLLKGFQEERFELWRISKRS